MQRVFDVILASFALVVLSPVLLLVSAVLAVTGEREIFFRQARVGKDGKIFRLFKFATMLKNSPNVGSGTVTLKDDPRVLPVGKLLRATKINELPQLWNVVVGDMSLIGPRPQAERCFFAFSVAVQNEIIKVQPGLSGVGPIVFSREETLMDGLDAPLEFYDNVIAPYKGELEVWYVHHRSFKLYLTLIILTLLIVSSSKTDLVWRFIPSLPQPPIELRSLIDGY